MLAGASRTSPGFVTPHAFTIESVHAEYDFARMRSRGRERVHAAYESNDRVDEIQIGERTKIGPFYIFVTGT